MNPNIYILLQIGIQINYTLNWLPLLPCCLSCHPFIVRRCYVLPLAAVHHTYSISLNLDPSLNS
jgi:hypothetical protein